MRSWFISEAEKRIGSLTANLERIKDFRANKAEMYVILDALAGKDPDLITKTVKKLTAGQHSVSLDRWITMQVEPPDFLKTPNLQLLDQAQAVVDSYRRAYGRVRMTIPPLIKLPNFLKKNLEHPKTINGLIPEPHLLMPLINYSWLGKATTLWFL